MAQTPKLFVDLNDIISYNQHINIYLLQDINLYLLIEHRKKDIRN
jgi:hypothetical protein